MLGRHLTLRDGRAVRVASPGILNTDAGPDFSNARICVDGTDWIGNVEIHVKASDWYRHSHQTDRAYDNVILHVVAIDDTEVLRSDGTAIPQTCVTFPENFYRIYASLAEGINNVRCRGMLEDLSPLQQSDWLGSLAVERMQRKAAHIIELHRASAGDWERTCFISLARALGFGLNSDPFEILARSLSLNHLARHSDNLFQLEAILFGQAGMLDMSVNIFDEYYQSLCREYYFLSRKYGLIPMSSGLWKFARTRPGNFPHRRIALLARYLYGGFSLMSDILARRGDPDQSRELFEHELEGYWSEHSSFGSPSHPQPSALSTQSVDLLLINLVAPLLYAYCRSIGDPERAAVAFDLWESIPGEKNSIIRQWLISGLKCRDAMDSQAMIQLRKEYCDRGRCLDCRFGHALLRKSVVFDP